MHRAKELAFTAKIVNGKEAFDMGLVNAVVAADDLDAATADIVAAIASGPPIAIAAMKRQLDLASMSSLSNALELETLSQSVNVTTDDMREAFMAYAEKRTPNFQGK